ncbi:MAG: hypothetical protein AAF990_27000 [Bacteroidota bacterium]
MILINRIDPPDHLRKPSVKRETNEAIKLFDPERDGEQGIEEKRKKFKFSQYSDEKVKKELIKMCRKKCAYCESSFLHVYYGDIEHFRPKKKVIGVIQGQKVERVGYYWLCNDWDNLLLSCLFCNQAKKQMVKVTRNQQSKIIVVTIGKQNSFPLNDEATFLEKRNHRNWDQNFPLEEKQRLLVNPCLEDPEELFAYTKEGVIKPRFSEGPLYEKAVKSIEVYALQRLYLVQEREKRLIEIFAQCERVREAMRSFNDKVKDGKDNPAVSNPVVRSYYRNLIERSIVDLLKFTRATEVFAGMARFFVDKFLKEEMRLSQEHIDAMRKMNEPEALAD